MYRFARTHVLNGCGCGKLMKIALRCFERSTSCHSIWPRFRFFDFLQLNLAIFSPSKLPNRCVITWSALPALRSSGAACLCPKSGWRQQMAWRKWLCDQALLSNQDRFAYRARTCFGSIERFCAFDASGSLTSWPTRCECWDLSLWTIDTKLCSLTSCFMRRIQSKTIEIC